MFGVAGWLFGWVVVSLGWQVAEQLLSCWYGTRTVGGWQAVWLIDLWIMIEKIRKEDAGSLGGEVE